MRTTQCDLVLDLEQLRSVTLEDAHVMREILGALLDDAGRHAAELDSALRSGDLSRSIRVARASARACDYVGAYRAGGVLRSLERAAAAGDRAAAAAAMTSLRAELDSLRSETVNV